jgi:hypothetical protein
MRRVVAQIIAMLMQNLRQKVSPQAWSVFKAPVADRRKAPAFGEGQRCFQHLLHEYQGTLIMLNSLKKFLIYLLITCCISAGMITFIEGASSLLFVGKDFVQQRKPKLAEHYYAQYDSMLGWINIPETKIKNFYGIGRNLTINSQGFRSRKNFSLNIPRGRTRIICSGDSFTLGYGVDDDATWCELLNVLEPKFETINMGQGGYGIDQAYLWYKRDGTKFQHDFHLFAFIMHDFSRMENTQFAQYSKPMFTLNGNNELELRNIPVPKGSLGTPWRRQIASSASQLRLLQLLTGVKKEARDLRGSREISPRTMEIAYKLFEELQKMNRTGNSQLILVFLPSRGTLKELEVPESKVSAWKNRFHGELTERDLEIVDLHEDFQKLSKQDRDQMFIPEGEMEFPSAAGHYNERGNRFVAEALLRRIHDLLKSDGSS